MSTIINGTSSAITFPDTTVQNTAFTTGAVTQSTIATGVAGTGPAFSAYNSSATALASNVSTKVLFQTEVFDTNNNFASSTFTPTVAGYYQINGTVRVDYTSALLTASIYKNGSQLYTGSFQQPSSTQAASVCSGLVYCNGTTDYVEIYAFVSGAGNTTTGQGATAFNGCLVRAA